MMVEFSNIPEDELFKICLDFWHFLTYNILMKTKGNQYYDNCKFTSFIFIYIDNGLNLGVLNSSFMHS